MSKPAIVMTSSTFAIREINALETRIVKAEDGADDMLWDQARQVVEQLDADGGPSQRQLAKQWINARTGDPYDHTHVLRVRRTWNQFGALTHQRPRFRDAYNEIANAAPSRSVHHSSESVEHYTPAELLALVIEVFGAIDLDPCSDSTTPPNVPARQHFTAIDDGLSQPWRGRVFMNPPYGDAIGHWTEKLKQEWAARKEMDEAIALVPARTDTAWWRDLTADCDDIVVCFWNGRLTFVGNTDPAPFPSALVYFGPKHDLFSRVFWPHGTLWCRPPMDFFVDHS